jgi:hypothetical protein
VFFIFFFRGRHGEEASLIHVSLNRGPAGKKSSSSSQPMTDTMGGAGLSNSTSGLSASGGLSSSKSGMTMPDSPNAGGATPRQPKVLVPKAIMTMPARPPVPGLSGFESPSSHATPPSHVMPPPLAMPSPTLSSARMVGVGIIFSTDERGGLKVKGLAPGGPAASTRMIFTGDTLVEIDGRNVYRQSVADVQDQVVGLINSTVTLGFQREVTGDVYRVQLRRVWDPSLEELTTIMGENVPSPSPQASPGKEPRADVPPNPFRIGAQHQQSESPQWDRQPPQKVPSVAGASPRASLPRASKVLEGLFIGDNLVSRSRCVHGLWFGVWGLGFRSRCVHGLWLRL